MHRALARGGREPDTGAFAIHGEDQPSVLGRLADRGLQDELKGSAYVVIEGVDGRAHHVRFGSLEATGDAAVGAVVEVRPFDGQDGQRRVSLAVRSDLCTLEAQIRSSGCNLARPDLDRPRADRACRDRVRRGRARCPGETGGSSRGGRTCEPARRAHAVRPRPARYAASAARSTRRPPSCRPRPGCRASDRLRASMWRAFTGNGCNSPPAASR